MEAATIIAALRKSNVKICYVDEYNVSEQDFRLYNWQKKGEPDYLYNQPRRASLHMIAAVTDHELVTLIVLTHTIASSDFLGLVADAIDKVSASC